MEPTKKDWKLFREKIGGWQEAYMERLIQRKFSIVGLIIFKIRYKIN